MNNLKVNDLVIGSNLYNYTNDKMYVGKILEVENSYLYYVKILLHENKSLIDEEYWCDSGELIKIDFI
jgi:hypothetical protein